MGWKALVRVSCGVSHIKQDIPIQDSGGYICFEDIIIGVVSDGAGSAKFSETGSKLAVRVALISLKEWLKSKKNKGQIRFNSLEEAVTLFSSTLKKVVNQLNTQAQENDCELNDFACTLLLFLAAPDWIAAMQIGDGFIVVKAPMKEYTLLFKPDKGEFANETTFVTSTNAEENVQIEWIRDFYPEFICTSTDGLERLAIRFSDWKPYEAFFLPLENYLKTTIKLEEKGGYVQDFLDSDQLNARTDDDKTLLLCLHNTSFPAIDGAWIPNPKAISMSKRSLSPDSNLPIKPESSFSLAYKVVLAGITILSILILFTIIKLLVDRYQNNLQSSQEVLLAKSYYKPLNLKDYNERLDYPLTIPQNQQPVENKKIYQKILNVVKLNFFQNKRTINPEKDIFDKNIQNLVKREFQDIAKKDPKNIIIITSEPKRIIAIANIEKWEYCIELSKDELDKWKIVWAGKRLSPIQ
ncbi:PP2C family serine/threonine-protein phosphatase [Nostoc sp.]|uniref:PP2C family serine/threonine-protein phosphatase n=1 Tax=Nostoc sp. TaxID=1180 RepID=UPI002FF8CB31